MLTKVKRIFYFLVIFSIIVLLWNTTSNSEIQNETEIVRLSKKGYSGLNAIKRQIDFNYNEHILAFVHIQKTGGSNFDRRIIKHLLVKTSPNTWKNACHLTGTRTATDISLKKKNFRNYKCLREAGNRNQSWYFSRQTFGWICGLHADFSELRKCVPRLYKNISDRNIYYFTILRDPVKRYLSEWQHVARGATWKRKKEKACSK